MLHEELKRVLTAVAHDPDLADITRRAIYELTPESERIKSKIAAARGVILFRQLDCLNASLATDLLTAAGYRKASVRLDGVQYSAWVHGECRYPKAALSDLLQGSGANEQERQGVPGHHRV